MTVVELACMLLIVVLTLHHPRSLPNAAPLYAAGHAAALPIAKFLPAIIVIAFPFCTATATAPLNSCDTTSCGHTWSGFDPTHLKYRWDSVDNNATAQFAGLNPPTWTTPGMFPNYGGWSAFTNTSSGTGSTMALVLHWNFTNAHSS